jgi:hypothetical protein
LCEGGGLAIARARLRLLQNVHSGHFYTIKLFELQAAHGGGAKWRRVCGRSSLSRSARLFEVETLVRKHLDHPNVVPIIGLCDTMLVEEWMVNLHHKENVVMFSLLTLPLNLSPL